MKTIVDTKEEGMEALLGKQVILFCMNYFYTGELLAVGKREVKLGNPSIVYETGAFAEAKWKDAQRLHVNVLKVRIPSIEAYAEGK
jgi:hypothetical protein